MLNDEELKEMCELFKCGSCIPELMKKYGFGRNKITRLLKEGLEDEYRTYAKKISVERMKLGSKNYKLKGIKIPRTTEWNKKISEALKGRKFSDETKRKISESASTRFDRGTLTKESIDASRKKAVATSIKNGSYKRQGEKHSKWMKQHNPNLGMKMSDEVKQRMSDSHKNFYKNGGVSHRKGIPHSKEVRAKISEYTSQMWKDGKFGFGNNGLFRSKLEISIFDAILKIFPKAVHSYPVSDQRTYVYDIYVPDLNLVIEINGDYWHLNPLLYDENFFDNSRNISSTNIWENDKKKIDTAARLGYRTAVIWENDINNFGVESAVKNMLLNDEPLYYHTSSSQYPLRHRT